jgi:hypothetical protein
MHEVAGGRFESGECLTEPSTQPLRVAMRGSAERPPPAHDPEGSVCLMGNRQPPGMRLRRPEERF